MNRLALMASFSAVAAAGSFTRAAVRLGLSKSVVSRHVSELERELGAQLLYRSTHQLSLTEAGARYYRHCQELDQVAERAEDAVHAVQAGPSGPLRVTLPQTLVVSRVGDLIADFQRAHPAVLLDVRVTSLQVDPIEEGFDVALRIGNLRDSSLACRKLRDVRIQAVAAPAYLKRHGIPDSPEALREHNCLVYSEFESRGRWKFNAGTASSRPIKVAGNLSTNSAVLLLNALFAGQGIVVGPDLMFERHLARNKLKVVLADFPLESTALYALYPSGRFASVNRRTFIDYLVTQLRQPEPGRAGSPAESTMRRSRISERSVR